MGQTKSELFISLIIVYVAAMLFGMTVIETAIEWNTVEIIMIDLTLLIACWITGNRIRKLLDPDNLKIILKSRDRIQSVDLSAMQKTKTGYVYDVHIYDNADSLIVMQIELKTK